MTANHRICLTITDLLRRIVAYQAVLELSPRPAYV